MRPVGLVIDRHNMIDNETECSPTLDGISKSQTSEPEQHMSVAVSRVDEAASKIELSRAKRNQSKPSTEAIILPESFPSSFCTSVMEELIEDIMKGFTQADYEEMYRIRCTM